MTHVEIFKSLKSGVWNVTHFVYHFKHDFSSSETRTHKQML